MKWLAPDGVAAALLVGAAVWWGLGWPGLVPLSAFLISGSLLARLAGGRDARRTATQVLANGGIAALAAALGVWPAAMGAIAAAGADTWATEIGSFSQHPPRSIRTGAAVPPGQSGGVTALGTAGGVAGALAMAACAALVRPGVGSRIVVLTASGTIGMLVDSLLGATAQALYECPVCGRRCERPSDACHGDARLVRGWRWLDNDGVNFACTVAGSCAAALLTL